ncbi:MAG TPA: hypothetical protein VGK13_03375 [Methanocellaceae archaeon]|jgi:hypothetical protein
MRVNRIKVIIVFVCIAVALTTATLPANAITLPTSPTSPLAPHTFYPINMFSDDMSSAFSLSGGERTPVSSGNTDHSFLTQALDLVPASDDQTKSQMNAIKSMQQSYQPGHTAVKTSPSWMDQFVQPSVIDGSANPAESAYSRFIMGEPNMTNIYD